MKRIRVAGDTGRWGNRECMPGRNDAVCWLCFRRDDQRVAVYTANAFLNMDVFKVGAHVIFVTVDAQIVGYLEETLLTVWIMAVHAAHIG